MKKKVLFFSPYAILPFHFETELEIAEKYIKKGYDVTFLTCDGNLPSCDVNPIHKPSICVTCKSRRKSGLHWLGLHNIQIKSFYQLNQEQQEIIQKFNHLDLASLEDLKNISIDGSDIGLGVFGSVVCALRDPEPDIQIHLQFIRKTLISSVTVHFSLKNYFTQNKPDEVVIFNGRMAVLRPVLRLAQSLGIQAYIHERSGDLNRYYLTRNTYPHDLSFMKREIELTYYNSNFSASEKLAIATEWFEERSNNHPQSWISYTENQKKDLLPKTLNHQNINVVIFNSSEDEMASIQGWESPFYKNQNDGIYQILSAFKHISDVKFFLRVHPNLAKVCNSQTRFLNDILSEISNLEIIPSESPISTYALLDACDVVITFGSTVGIEAVYRKKPSILMGRALYEDLGGVILPKSHSNLVDIIHTYLITKEFPTVHNSKAAFIKYGFFQKTYGELFEYVRPKNAFSVSVQRHNESPYFVNPSLAATVLVKVLCKFNF